MITLSTSNPKTLLFIDRAVDNYQQLVDGAISGAEVVILDPNHDGIEQITEVLSQNPQLEAIHILGHGSPGCLYLGNSHLGLDTLDRYASQLQTWKDGRKACPPYSLLLYGCNVAAGDAGEAFIKRLHHLTGANIAASAQLTGNAAAGGDSELEVTTGKIETPLAIVPEVREAYTGVLATFTVDTRDDEDDGVSVMGVSLRDAINAANTTAGADIILFNSTLSGTIILSNGQLLINDALTINGLGASNVTVSGNNASWVFLVNDGNNSNQIAVNINGLTITGGNSSEGGGVFNRENLTLSNSIIFGNTADFGGGILNQGTASTSNSTISGNTADFGGGIFNKERSTLSISNSTISGNTASNYGGGIFNASTRGIATVTSSIIAANTALSPRFDSDGLFIDSDIGVTDPWTSFGSKFISGGNNLIGDADGAGRVHASAQVLEANFGARYNDIIGTTRDPINPRLAPLADNGGPTPTHVLLGDSLAINNGSNPKNFTTDQRGTGFNRVVGGQADIGAFEVQQPIFSLTVDTLTDENDKDISAGDVSLREAIAFTAIGGTVNFASGLAGKTITLGSSGELLINKNLTINGLRASNLTVSGNNASRVFNIANAGNVNIGGLTITGGNAAQGGGVINSNSNLTFSNSTISGNTATSGGGIFNAQGTTSFGNSTISGNTASNVGGGIYFGLIGRANVTSSIIATNTDNKDIAGLSTFTSGGSNLIGNGNGVDGFTNGVNGDIVGTSANPIDPKLAPLANNGGPTKTQALLTGSPAINTGSNPNNLTTDQRGAGFNRVVGGQADIGAYEIPDDELTNTQIGTDANETFVTSPQRDNINADGGNDQVLSRYSELQQNDTIDGSTGSDTFVLNAGAASNSVTINLTNASDQLQGDNLAAVTNFEAFDLSNFSGSSNFTGTSLGDSFQGGAGNDTIQGKVAMTRLQAVLVMTFSMAGLGLTL